MREDKPERKPVTGVRRVMMHAGRDQGITPVKMAKTLKSAIEIDDAHIGGISVEDTLSFVTLPVKDADLLVARAFSDNPESPLFTATMEKGKGKSGIHSKDKVFEKKHYDSKKPR